MGAGCGVCMQKRYSRYHLAALAVAIYCLNAPVAFAVLVGDLAVLLAAVAVLVRRKRVGVYGLLFMLPATLIACGLILGTLAWSGQAGLAYQAARYVFAIGVLAFVLSRLSLDEALLFLTYCLWAIVALAGFGIVLYLSAYDFGSSLNWIANQRLSLWYDTNRLATIYMIGIVLCVGLGFHGSLGVKKALVLLTILFLSLSFTMSIGALLGTGIATGSMFLTAATFSRHARHRVLALAVVLTLSSTGFVGIATGLSAADLVPDRFDHRVMATIKYPISGDRPNDFASVEERSDYLRASATLINTSPALGLGVGQRTETGVYPHTLPILLYLEGGAIAFLGWFAFISLLALPVLVILNQRCHRSIAPLAVGLLSGLLVAMALHGHMYQLDYYAASMAMALGAARSFISSR